MVSHYRWLVAASNPQGTLVPFTAEEEARKQADEAAWALEEDAAEQAAANYAAMRQQLTGHMQEALDLAALLDAGTATAAQQRRALALLLRGTVRLTRVVFSLLDDAP